MELHPRIQPTNQKKNGDWIIREIVFLCPLQKRTTERKTYLAELPCGYEGEFGPGIKTLVISLYYGGNMTQNKLLEFLEDIGISMSAGYLSCCAFKTHIDII